MGPILVALAFDSTDAALRTAAVTLARALGAGLHLVHVARPEPDFVGYDAGPPSARDAVAEALRDAHRRIEEGVEALTAAGLVVSGRLVRDEIGAGLLGEAERVDASWIAVGRPARGVVADALRGSTSRDLIRRAHRPVLVVPLG